MRTWKRYLALIMGVLVLLNEIPVYAAGDNAENPVVEMEQSIISEETEELDATEEEPEVAGETKPEKESDTTEEGEPEEEPDITEEGEPEGEPEVTEEEEPEGEPEVTEEEEPEGEPEVTEEEEPEGEPDITEGTKPEGEPEVTEGTKPEEELDITEEKEPEGEQSILFPSKDVWEDDAEEYPEDDLEDDLEEDISEWEYYYVDVYSDKCEMEPGEKQKLQVETDAPMEELTFESSNPSAVTVSEKGEVQAISGGSNGSTTVCITVKWMNPVNEENVCYGQCYITVQNIIKLNKTTYTVYTGQKKNTYRLKATTNPKGTVVWKSSKPSIADVNSKGVITPKKKGTVTITATANGVSADCKVTVKKPSLSLQSKATIYLKNPQTLEAVASPNATIKWKSSNTKIAKVDSKGKVTGKKKGTVTITATAYGIKKKCKVTIKEPTISISGYQSAWFSNEAITALYAGSTTKLSVTAVPAVSVKWKSSNKKIAKVDKNGVVTGIKQGMVTITASIPGAEASWKIKVVENAYSLNFTSRTIMVGNETTLYVKNRGSDGYVAFSVKADEDTGYWNSHVSYTTEGNTCVIKAIDKGTNTIEVSFSTYIDDSGYYNVLWNQSCKIKVVDSGISQQNFSIAKKVKKKLSLVNVGEKNSIESIKWSSSAPKVAVVNKTTGEVTGKKTGSAKITAVVTLKNGKTKKYSTNMKVSDPKLSSGTIVAALQENGKIALKGTNAYSNITWKSSKKSVATVMADGTIKAAKKGSTTVTVKVDGKQLKCKVYISTPELQERYALLAAGGTRQITVKGLAAKSKVTYKSSNSNVASVSKEGLITAIGGGRAEITVNADGREFTYLVEVASQAAIDACSKGEAIMSSSTYSQEYRMSEGYYDCSSLVFRAYGRNSALLGGSYSWAPTAAGMAQHMANTGKVIAWEAVSIDNLRPGDLIFYGQQDNGRYLGIYHVSMYYGNGYRLEQGWAGYYERDNIVMIARPVP